MSFVAALLRTIFHAAILTPFEHPLPSFFASPWRCIQIREDCKCGDRGFEVLGTENFYMDAIYVLNRLVDHTDHVVGAIIPALLPEL
jgi:hypothetical protein